MADKKINEDVTGTASIATRTDRTQHRNSEHEWRGGLKTSAADKAKSDATKAQIARAGELKKKKTGFKAFINKAKSRFKITEQAMDVNAALSKLKGLENKNNHDPKDTVTYGIEDDDGNIMKVTVKADQGKNFEYRLATEMGEIEANSIIGFQQSKISMAELLFTLKDEFDILDVEFPTIPSDVIYNADQVTYDAQDPAPPMGAENGMDDGMGQDPNVPVDPNAPPMGAEGGEEGMPIDGQDIPDEGAEGADGAMPPEGGPDGEPPMDGEMDDEGVEDFTDEMPVEDDSKSLMNSVLDLLKAQADAAKAEAEARAEASRALAAEYTAKAASGELAKQEDLARMDLAMDKQKAQEKEGKRLADLARFNVSQTSSALNSPKASFEGVTSFLRGTLLTELVDAEFDNEQTVRKELALVNQRYATGPNDDPKTQAYKRQMATLTTTELNAKLRKIRAMKVYSRSQQGTQQQDPVINTNTQQQGNNNANI